MLVEKIPTVMYLDKANEEGANIYINPQIEQLIGYAPSDFEHDPLLWYKVVLPDDFDRVMASIDSVLKTGRSVDDYRVI
jgi:PAS domain-containing protein